MPDQLPRKQFQKTIQERCSELQTQHKLMVWPNIENGTIRLPVGASVGALEMSGDVGLTLRNTLHSKRILCPIFADREPQTETWTFIVGPPNAEIYELGLPPKQQEQFDRNGIHLIKYGTDLYLPTPADDEAGEDSPRRWICPPILDKLPGMDLVWEQIERVDYLLHFSKWALQQTNVYRLGPQVGGNE
ncbi:hypothetical protein ACWDYH_00385 [Nocardia goodfellowii]